MSDTQETYTEQPLPDAGQEADNSLVVFFGIGMVINLVLITAYFIWAYKQWKKPREQDD